MRFEPRGSHSAHLIKKPLDERIADEARFIKTWFENPVGTGAVSPSGRFLARAMARAVDPLGLGPIVELGPGTGPVTDALIDRGIAPERLVLVEFDPQFCKLLQRRYPGATIIQGDAYDLAATLEGVLDEPAATVVSSLPLRNQPERHRLALLEQAFSVLQPGGSFVQFTYGIASPMPLRPGHHPCFEAEVSPPVWLNLPPARVWIYRAAETPALIRSRDGARIRVDFKPSRGQNGQGRPKQGIRLKACKARDELIVQAERVIDGLKPKRRGTPSLTAAPVKVRARPRRPH
ncbi:MAG: class I SAM-dependent methyltransferase [Janthinobacterium lividum]